MKSEIEKRGEKRERVPRNKKQETRNQSKKGQKAVFCFLPLWRGAFTLLATDLSFFCFKDKTTTLELSGESSYCVFNNFPSMLDLMR